MRRRIVVLFGGRSAEHEISCVSAQSVVDALDRDRYDPIAIGIDKDGGWHDERSPGSDRPKTDVKG